VVALGAGPAFDRVRTVPPPNDDEVAGVVGVLEDHPLVRPSEIRRRVREPAQRVDERRGSASPIDHSLKVQVPAMTALPSPASHPEKSCLKSGRHHYCGD